jgi:pyruvate dehydrogenase E2 component (dihydrolipoamide acetyltransferase)
MTGSFPAIGAQPPVPQPPVPQPAVPQQPPQAPPQAPPTAQTATRGYSTPIEPTSAQQTVARRMAESKATAPEFFVETEVDMTTCVAYREQLRSMVSPLPSFNDFVIKAAAQALRQYPKVNAAYKDGHFEQYSDVNIGVVLSASELLAVPTLFNVDQKGLAQIAGESQQLAEAVRTRTIQPSQMSGGTFSISNLGMYGVDRFTAILNPPQAAILAVGAINRRAVIAEDGMSLVIRQIMNMTLTCDHRILYGAEAAEFLGAIKAWLESPQLLQV